MKFGAKRAGACIQRVAWSEGVKLKKYDENLELKLRSLINFLFQVCYLFA